MGLAKKSSANITVKNTVYRWIVSGNDGFLDLLVEHFDGHGQRLEVQLDYEVGQITPRIVRGFILKALDLGWVPEQPGKQFRARCKGDQLILCDV